MSQQPTLIATTRARITVLFIAAAGLALSACTGPAGAEPSASPAPAASAPATQRPDPTYKPASENGPAENVPVPVMPDEASLKSQQGLQAFLPYWFETVSYAYETGDLTPLEQITAPGCAICKEFKKTIQAGHDGDKWIVGGQIEPTEIEDRFVETVDGKYAPIVFITQQPLVIYEDDKVVGKADGFVDPLLWVATVRYVEDHWIIEGVARPDGAS
ncbi:DUF6318 family protein [Arthrobacter sp. NPDC089319]|uniref:DUF6318 family protein n=1 Tax=Arthrobacter sp. NPDC089319 TaxID=3155915 RepID=UPI0034402A40